MQRSQPQSLPSRVPNNNKHRPLVAAGISHQEESWKTVRRLGKGAHGAVWLRQRIRRSATTTTSASGIVTAPTATTFLTNITTVPVTHAIPPSNDTTNESTITSTATNVAADMFAFKRMANMMQDHATAKQSLRELQFATTLCHPNIVTHHRIHCQSPRTGVFLQMEVMSASLAIFSSTMEQHLEPDQVRWLMYQLLCSVNYLHSGGILHRDIKPQNLLVRGNTRRNSFPPFTPQVNYRLLEQP
jgi:serine/threonine protein kinase